MIVFGILLFVPMLHINQAEFSKREKRRLAVFPTLMTENGINAAYGKNFESWFDDRFFLRKQIIHLFDKYRYSLSMDENPKALIGKDDWAFYKGDNSVSNYQNATLLSQDELEKITANLNDIQNFAKQNDQRFVLLIGPDKNKAYGEFFSEKYKKQRPDSESRTVQLLNYLKLHSDVRAVYPLDVIKANKDKGLLYYKDDTHWDDLGAYLAYKEMMQAVGEAPVKVDFQPKVRGGGGQWGHFIDDTVEKIHLFRHKISDDCNAAFRSMQNDWKNNAWQRQFSLHESEQKRQSDCV